MALANGFINRANWGFSQKTDNHHIKILKAISLYLNPTKCTVAKYFHNCKKGTRQNSYDLTPDKIVVEDKFFVSLECIQKAGGQGIMSSANLLGSSVIIRETSQANWEKENLVGVGFNVLAPY